MNKIKLVLLCAALLLVSCKTKEKLAYFEDLSTATEGVMGSSTYEIRIVPQDELFITVTSLSPQATAHFNLPLANPATQEKVSDKVTTQPQQQTYIVDADGNILFPQLGVLHVAGMTTSEINKMLTEKISEQVTDPIVRTELINFKVNVIGEVKEPRQVLVRSQRFSVLDALASAGDLTEFGKRSNVLVIREIDGEKHYARLNLGDSHVTSSPYFYLKQNDVVYVEPNKIRQDNSSYNQNNAFKLSVVSTIVSAASVIASLVIALTIKD